MRKTKNQLLADLDAFTMSYIETLLWSSTDEQGKPLDERHRVRGLTHGALVQCIRDCADFRDVQGYELWLDGQTEAHQGHMFCLTRNHCGAGFWDGDYPVAGEILTAACRLYGCVDPYVWRGRVYL